MYLSLMMERMGKWGRQIWKQVVLRSGVVTIVVVALAVLGLAIGWHAHIQGRFARLKADFKRSDVPHAPVAPRPGGQDTLVLERSAIENGTIPEFLSATLLPGRGMNVFQITALIPKKGQVKLLASPTLDEAAQRMNGSGDDVNGQQSLAMGGAIEAPWAGDIFGSGSGDKLTTVWRGKSLHLPAERRSGTAVATGGLLLAKTGTSAKTNVMPDGGEAEAVYDSGDFDGAWPSRMRVKSTVQLSSRAIEVTVVATNSGDDPQPVGIGWRPRFAVLNRNRGEMTLRLPSVTREEIRDRRLNVPSGRLLPAGGTGYDFSPRTGAALKELSLDETFVHLRQAPLDSGPVVELWDPANNFGLRMTMLSPSIKAIHVEAPAEKNFVMVEPRFNYDDPFGHEWAKDENTGMIVIQPSQSAQWKIRLEIYAPTLKSDGHF
jgi:galactose mutarotase-like enzyme